MHQNEILFKAICFVTCTCYAKIRDSCGEEHRGQIVVRVNYKSLYQLGSVSHCAFSSDLFHEQITYSGAVEGKIG